MPFLGVTCGSAASLGERNHMTKHKIYIMWKNLINVSQVCMYYNLYIFYLCSLAKL